MYTEGEWEVVVETEPSEYGGTLGKYITGIRAPEGTICEFLDDYGTDFSANAYLIAAAPDMYEACKEMITRFNQGTRFPLQSTIDKMNQALSKARGGN